MLHYLEVVLKEKDTIKKEKIRTYREPIVDIGVKSKASRIKSKLFPS